MLINTDFDKIHKILLRYIQILIRYIQILQRYVQILLRYIQILQRYIQILKRYIQILYNNKDTNDIFNQEIFVELKNKILINKLKFYRVTNKAKKHFIDDCTEFNLSVKFCIFMIPCNFIFFFKSFQRPYFDL